ncbi:hypothetical protein [Aquabacterium sp. J223]|uniref:hypothetical protein n=1 Tax=Aquabacterium sp. J223 TaxID=2898431 RepID=UPI0021ADB75E|nr:hypothetical protein [Aquabacterium sp. J223]UUX94564.1 hypothetical protein LRS07_14790 [Aquabacterium sp. J223]
MDTAMKVRLVVADGEFGTPDKKGLMPVVVKLPSPGFLDLMQTAYTLGLYSHPIGIGFVDLLCGQSRVNVALDLSDTTTRRMLASWRRHGARLELRSGDQSVCLNCARTPLMRSRIQAALTMPLRRNPALFTAIACSPPLYLSLSASPLPGQDEPVPNFLYSAAFSDEHLQVLSASA